MRIDEGAQLSQKILHLANHSLTRMGFLREVSSVLLEYCACDAIEIRLREDNLHYRWEAIRRPQKAFRFELVKWIIGNDGRVIPALRDNTDLERICTDVAGQNIDPVRPFFTRNGSFWIGETWESSNLDSGTGPETAARSLCIGGHYRSLAIMRFVVDEETTGLLHIKSEQRNRFSEKEIEFCEEVAQALGLAVADRLAQAALRERIKELTCLYGIAQIVERPGLSIDEVLQRIVELLPASWQYPEIATARIVLDEKPYFAHGFRPGKYLQSAEITINKKRRGMVEVTYLEDRPDLAPGAFLEEEEELIKAIAREVALFIERREAEEEKTNLHQQLIHADRLATIGQLAAGVAHELNEPLVSILGFGQLVQKTPNLPQEAEQDIEKIVTASLYAREVIKKLMVFSRQVPAKKSPINLNQVVEDALYFLEARCDKEDIHVIRDLAPSIPDIVADPAQLKQVLVNLVVNAIHAMPHGGTLTVSTQASGGSVILSVADNGMGIREDLLDKIFLPFFTTKDVDEGTGLGLAVVHGIITSHGGSIVTESQPGSGTRFDVCLPVIGPEATEGAVDGDTKDQ